MAYSEDVNVNLNVLAGTMSGVTAIMGGMSALTSSFGAMGTEAMTAFGAVDGLLVTTSGLLVTFGKQAADAFGEFEQGMKIVQTVSGQAQYSIAQLGEQANQLSVHYRTAIGDITEGLQTLGRAGLNSAETQLEVLESGLQTAKLEGRNLNGVLEEIIQNTAMLGGDLKSIDFGEQSAYLNSLMVGTSMTAPINSHDISQTLQYAGGTAAAAGANLENKDKLEDLMGTIAAFAQKGVKGSMSGTALRAFFTKPASQDTSVVDALSSIGLAPEDLWENGGESMKKVSDQVGIIKRRMDALHLSTMEQVELWGKIVGPKMGQQMMKLDSSSIRELTTDIQGAQSAEDLAAKTLQTYNQKVSSLGQQGQVAFRELGEKAVMFLNPLVDILNAIAQFASNPVANMGIWIGSLALLGHGIRAAWNMVTTIISQIKGLIMSVVNNVEAIAESTAGVTSGFAQSGSQIDVLNTKLHETDNTLQAIQAKALGIRGGYEGTAYIAAGMSSSEEKINKGVLASAEMNVFRGDGIIGEKGKFYTNKEAAQLKSDALNLSKENAKIRDGFEERNNIITKQYDQINQKILNNEKKIKQLTEEKTGAQKSILSNNEKIDAINTYSGKYDQVPDFNKFSGNTDWDIYNRNLLKEQIGDAKKTLVPDENIPKDINGNLKSVNALLEEERILNKQLVDTVRQINLEYDERLAQAEATGMTVGKNPEKIRNWNNYENKVKEDRVAALEEAKAPIKAAKAELKKELAIAKESERTAQQTGVPYGYRVGTEEDIAKLEEANAKSGDLIVKNDQSIANLTRQNDRYLNELRNLKLIPQSVFDKFPVQSKQVIEESFKNGATNFAAQLRVVTEDEYKNIRRNLPRNEMGFLTDRSKFQEEMNKAFHESTPEAIFTKNGKKMVAYYDFLPSKKSEKEADAFLSRMWKDSKKSGSIDEYGDQLSRSQTVSTSSGGIRAKLIETGNNRLRAWNNALQKTTSSISNFGSNVMQNYRIMTTGFSQPLSQLQSQVNTSITHMEQGIEMGVTSVEEAFIELGERTNLSSSELMKVIESSEALSQRFWELGLAGQEDYIATEDEVKARIQNVVATEQEASAKKGAAASSFLGNVGGKIGNTLSSVVGFMGGPFMAGMMAFSVASSLFQQSVGSWQKEMSDAANKLSEAKDKMTTAEDSIKELYSSENNTISEADLDKVVDYQYGAIQAAYDADLSKHSRKTKPKFSDMYNNEVVKVQNLKWTDEEKENDTLKTAEDLQALNESTETLTLTEEENIKKLEENTVALNQASYAFSQALNKQSKAFNDPLYGYEGAVTTLENTTRQEGFMAIVVAAIASFPTLVQGTIDSNQTLKDIQKDSYDFYRSFLPFLSKGEGFFDHDSGVLTTHQAGDNYDGSTDFAPLLSTDMYQLGVEGGMKQYFGSDFDSLVQSVDQINHKSGATLEYFKGLSNNNFQGMDADDMAMAQMLWKEDPETVQKLGKQMYWSETEHHTGAMNSWKTGKLQERNPKENHPSSKDYYKDVDKKKYTVNDKNLKNTMDKIYRMTDGKLSYANMLAMGQMQMLSDMYSVANEQIYPALSQTMIAANQNVLATGAAGTNAGSASQNAGAAANNAAVIAGMLGEKLKQEATGLEYENDYLQDPDAPKSWWGFGGVYSKEEFTQKMADLDNTEFNKYRQNKWRTEAEWTAKITHPEWGPDDISAYADRSMSKILNSDGTLKTSTYKDMNVIENTILGPGLKSVENSVRSAYEQSKVGEYGGNSGGSGGGSGGSGDGKDKDKDSGSKKERVDLVLCNKKEIPKLNVNLFKKPPNFTILNKNFKLRDIKINSQDKPKAIMNAIKNGIIETQKRMDPKIIQDEDAVYDPLAATDGSSTPSGTTKTTT